MQDSVRSLPEIRILHQLGRSGGTLIAKCLATMDSAVLLSEVHPYGKVILERSDPHISQYLPMVQAHDWFNLVSQDEAERSKKGEGKSPSEDFAAEIAVIDARCRAQGKSLILRDFNNLDFVGIKRRAVRPYRFTTVEALKTHFHPLRFFTVRHPADQWVSLSKLFPEDITPALDRFLLGFRKFSEHAAKVGFVRYEDFSHDPEAALRRICASLALPYDPGWQQRWAAYRNITGDTRARSGESAILPARKNTLDSDLRCRLEANVDYRVSLELLEYQA